MKGAHPGRVNFDYDTLDQLRRSHPAWRLLRSDHAALAASFLERVFIAPNERVLAQSDLAEALEDELYALRERSGEDAFPRDALDYLNDWASPEKGWLRKFYRRDSDEPQFDLTPATEKAIAWLASLIERSFVGTESRLLTLFELLRQMSEGTETDPQVRIGELRKRRDALDAEIERARSGDMPLLDDTALKDRFQQFMQLARDLLTDFREVEQNFRILDRRVRERIALWEGSRGELLEDIMSERDAISDSDQGRSFRAFWDFLMSRDRQEELTRLLERILALPAVTELKPDTRTRRIHYDWLEAGEHTQRTVAQLSQQLRRFLDDKAWIENRRIMDILRGIESKSLALRESPPPGAVMHLEGAGADITLPMERPLHTPPLRPTIADVELEADSGGATVPEGSKLPRLVVRRPLSFHVSLLLALLRRKLAEFDAGGGDTRLVLTRDEIVEMVRVFLPDTSNEARLIDRIDSHLNRVVGLGFLRRMRVESDGAAGTGAQSTFEVRRILKAYVDAQWLAELDARLADYRALLEGTGTDGDGAGTDEQQRHRESGRGGDGDRASG